MNERDIYNIRRNEFTQHVSLFFWKCQTTDYVENLALKIYCSFRNRSEIVGGY